MKGDVVPDELWSSIDGACDSLDNYLVIDDAPCGQVREKTCALYFSSHGLYFPKTVSNFEQQSLERNRFEWFGTRVRCASRHIFLRDLRMCWYQAGISKRLGSIDKVHSLLRELTDGYETVCVGSSAGAYAALLFASLLRSSGFTTTLVVGMCCRCSGVVWAGNPAKIVRRGISWDRRRPNGFPDA